MKGSPVSWVIDMYWKLELQCR